MTSGENGAQVLLPKDDPSSPPFAPRLQRLRSLPNQRTEQFRAQHFPEVRDDRWHDWHWQAAHRYRRLEQLQSVLSLSSSEIAGLARGGSFLPIGITPYYMSLLEPLDASQGLRRTVIPSLSEFVRMPGEADDPLAEDQHSPVPGLVHRYPDRVLLLALDYCATYCRYCTRSRLVGQGELSARESRLEQAFRYIERTPGIRDVLISGGDPLSLSDAKLAWILGRLRSIPHVEFIRIGTKMPAVMPQRITPELVAMLKLYHPLWMSLHFLHPDECTPEAGLACNRLADAGIPLGAQAVLLKGVNDSVETLRELSHLLLLMRVRPYYLYQCDPIGGSAHFRTSVRRGMELVQQMRGHTTGYGVWTYVVDAPGGGGKIPMQHQYLVGRDGDELILENYSGQHYRYPDPSAPSAPTYGLRPATDRAGRCKAAQHTLTTIVGERPGQPALDPQSMHATTPVSGLSLGMTYDLQQEYAALGYSDEELAELDRPETIDAIEAALRSAGHRVTRIGGLKALVSRLAGGERWDLVFNIAEGLHGAARESQVPALLDAFGLAYTFADPLALATCLDKRLAKQLVREHGIPTPEFRVVAQPAQADAVDMAFPLFVKPIAEGTSRGISGRSICRDQAALAALCRELLERYRQPVLVERYLPGREFTVGILGTGGSAKALGALEIQLTARAEPGVYSYLNKKHYQGRVEFRLARDDEALRAVELALAAYRALGCRDAGRVDMRSDAGGGPQFIEANALPGLQDHDLSDLPILARKVGISHRQLILEIVDGALSRLNIDANRSQVRQSQPQPEAPAHPHAIDGA